MKILPVGAELFHADRWADGQTDITKPIAAFRNFVNAPKMLLFPLTECFYTFHDILKKKMIWRSHIYGVMLG
jgi:hypothetical protein